MPYSDPRFKVFAHLDRLALWRHGTKAVPVTVEWDLSNRCPLGCAGCPTSHLRTEGLLATDQPTTGYEDCGDIADPDLVKKGLSDMATAGVNGVVWSGGGEPLTHPHWHRILDDTATLGLQQGMYTSGIGLSGKDAHRLMQRLAWIVVSLDAPDADTYAALKQVPPATFTAACRSIQLLTATTSSVPVGVSFLLDGHTTPHVERMLALARRLDAIYVLFRPRILVDARDPAACLDDRSWVTEVIPLLRRLSTEHDVEVDVGRFEEYRDWSGRAYPACYGIRLSTVVTPDGRLWMCCQRRGMTDSLLGNLTHESFADIWARHPGQWMDFAHCRVMCRLHLMNTTLAQVYTPRIHEAFL